MPGNIHLEYAAPGRHFDAAFQIFHPPDIRRSHPAIFTEGRDGTLELWIASSFQRRFVRLTQLDHRDCHPPGEAGRQGLEGSDIVLVESAALHNVHVTIPVGIRSLAHVQEHPSPLRVGCEHGPVPRLDRFVPIPEKCGKRHVHAERAHGHAIIIPSVSLLGKDDIVRGDLPASWVGGHRKRHLVSLLDVVHAVRKRAEMEEHVVPPPLSRGRDEAVSPLPVEVFHPPPQAIGRIIGRRPPSPPLDDRDGIIPLDDGPRCAPPAGRPIPIMTQRVRPYDIVDQPVGTMDGKDA